MESIIRRLQAEYTNLSITGLFLVYPQYYIHMLEAPEDIIYRHFKSLHDDKIQDCEILQSIFLPTYHHVHQRFFSGWFHVFTIPPTLIQKIESYELEDIQVQMSNCYRKIYAFCDYISSTVRDRSVPMKDVVRNLNDKISRLYPESTLLEYLLNIDSPVLLTVKEYLKVYSSVPLVNLYSGNTTASSIVIVLYNFKYNCFQEYLQYQKKSPFIGYMKFVVRYR
ncbi:uncharacterized protein LOC108626702 [Ceratina calcarata]|uniref:Uncharacterized protein LOC108626702 n=1 Tax=Ceratina calcarata TaxID=156304 RepID=A0AAJ7WC06_9HYME|nr:uncharacterized protein LOC108626702 [Ceratina calcarata]